MATTKAYRLITLLIKNAILFIIGIVLIYIALPNPIFSFPLLILVAFAPLFIMNRSLNGFFSWIVNFIFFLVMFLAVLFPLDIKDLIIDISGLKSLIFISALIALIYPNILTLSSFICKKFKNNFNPLIYGTIWAFSSYLICFTPLVFPFPLEAVLAPYYILIQSAYLFSSYLIVFLVIATNSLIAEFIVGNRSNSLKIIFGYIIVIHIANLLYGFVSINMRQDYESKISVSIIQPNITSKQYMFMHNKLFEGRMNERVIRLSNISQKKKPSLVIWPELSANYIFEDKNCLDKLHQKVTSKGNELLFGTYIKKNGKRYNASVILKKDGNISGPYFKTRLFPIFESFDYTNGTEYIPLQSESQVKKIGAMICLEAIYPQIAKNLVKNGAQMLVLISNDNSFGNSVIPYLHKNLMVLRAIENNRFSIHASNNGPSCVVDNKGRVLCESKYGATAFLNADITIPAQR